MIPIVRPAAPIVLQTKGVEAAKAHCDEHDAAPADYRSGAKTFDFRDAIYTADEVKAALISAQHDKCAFCESFFAHTGYGDVEHFRPKGAYRQRSAGHRKRPGYYWLAYDWDNLFYSCQLCNQRFKRELFPLTDGRRRARPRTRDHSNESPLLIDPAARDPTLFIGFRKEYAYPVDDCPEGVTTIEVLGLNRPKLVENRRRRLDDLTNLVELCEHLRWAVRHGVGFGPPDQLRAREESLAAKLQDAGEYAAMARAYLGR